MSLFPPADRPARAARTPEERREEERRRKRLAATLCAAPPCLDCREVCTARCAHYEAWPFSSPFSGKA